LRAAAPAANGVKTTLLVVVQIAELAIHISVL
jgi:hypothetical protein